MKIYTEPKVWLVTHTELNPMLDTEEIDGFLPGFKEWYDGRLSEVYAGDVTAGELAIELGGRGCYHSWDNRSGRDNQAYIRNIMNHEHYSVLEHASAGFYVFTNREVTHELVRHRHQSFSQESTRFVSYGEGPGQKEPSFVIPEMFLEAPEDKATVEQYLKAVMGMYSWAHAKAQERYDLIPDRTMKRKLSRQAARGALPHWLSATIMLSGNYRTWFEALPKRLSEHADIGIRMVYLQILTELEALAPHVFADRFERKTAPDGTEYAELIDV